jgi:hypothetical protein
MTARTGQPERAIGKILPEKEGQGRMPELNNKDRAFGTV